MAIPALDGTGLPSLLPQLQVTALTLPMIGILEIGPPPLCLEVVAGAALLYGLPLLPKIAFALPFMVALPAVDAPVFVQLMVKPHRRFFPMPLPNDAQPASSRGLGGEPGLGP